MDWNEYQTTNINESSRLIKIEENYEKKLDKIIMILTFMVTIAFVLLKERV